MSDVREASDDVTTLRALAEFERTTAWEFATLGVDHWNAGSRAFYLPLANGRNRRAALLSRAADALEENVLLRTALVAQCWEHAGNCCASWCEPCKAGVAALNALDARRAVRT